MSTANTLILAGVVVGFVAAFRLDWRVSVATGSLFLAAAAVDRPEVWRGWTVFFAAMGGGWVCHAYLTFQKPMCEDPRHDW